MSRLVMFEDVCVWEALDSHQIGFSNHSTATGSKTSPNMCFDVFLCRMYGGIDGPWH